MEAASAKHRYIEKEHVLLGLLSLKKSKTLENINKLKKEHLLKLISEQRDIDDLIHGLGLTTTSIRRQLRNKLIQGEYKHKDKIIHRSADCKRTFLYADELAGNTNEITAVNLLTAIVAKSNPTIEQVLNEFGINPNKIFKMAAGYQREEVETKLNKDLEDRDFTNIHSYTLNSNVSRLTIMFDDIVGSTALYHQLGDEEFYKLLKYHDETIKKVIRKKGRGEIIKSTGDGFLMVFSSPVVAVECALNIQKEFFSHKILRVRIGMDMGEVKQVLDEKSRDIFGIKVSTASRITSAAFGGHILTSKSIWEETHKRITNKSMGWKYLGSRSFKPGEPTIDIYEVFNTHFLKNPMDHLPEIKGEVKNTSRLFSSVKTPFLNKFGRDLTQEALQDKLGPFAGRRNEILQIIQSLSQKYNNNPLLIGKAGVGKTSLVQALAVRIAKAKDSHALAQKRIILIDFKSVLTGTRAKNEFEDRVIKLLNEAQSQRNTILFIDDIHNYIGCSTPDSKVNVANILNPRILEGKLQIIGATTESDFERYIKVDASLERGFQKLLINEPSEHETMEMLDIFRKKLEEFHRIWITDRALEAAIKLSGRFDPDSALPAKAIDLLDEAGAQVHIPDLSMISDRKQPQLGVAHTVLNILSIARVLSQRTGVPLKEIMAAIGD